MVTADTAGDTVVMATAMATATAMDIMDSTAKQSPNWELEWTAEEFEIPFILLFLCKPLCSSILS
jgi:hypothetical protein